MPRILRFLTTLAMLSLLSGCGGNTMKDISDRAEQAKTKEQLEAALGQPKKFEKISLPVLGTGEIWTYEGSDGDVVFTLHNGKVKTSVTQPNEKTK